MSIKKWLANNTEDLKGKTIAITGSTGGLGREICCYLAELGASLILVDRNRSRSEIFAKDLTDKFEVSVKCITADLEEISSVKSAADELIRASIDIFIHNAGAYSIPRRKCSTGFDNVFQINFVSPYYIIKRLMQMLRIRKGRVIVVGSIAHNYSKCDLGDVDFSSRSQAAKVYGNAKRYLMFSLFELFKNEDDVSLAVTHPGIAFTNITAHYPKVIFAIIKHPMKIIFMKPKKACLSILKGVFEPCGYHEWIGPRLLDIWGMPQKKKLRTCSVEESRQIFETAEKIYNNV